MKHEIDYVAEALETFTRLLPILSNPGRESAMYNTVREMFLPLGFQDAGLKLVKEEFQIHKMVAADPGTYRRDTPNLGMYFAGDINKPHLVFNAHLDHYFAGKVTTRQIIDGDWMVSDGEHILGGDCKLGIALIYTLVKHIMMAPNPPSIDLIFDTCEEAGLIGAIEFYEARQYHQMLFWETYKSGRPVYCYIFDGCYDEKMQNVPYAYINRASALSLSKYYMNPNHDRTYDIIKGRIQHRRWSKRELTLVAALNAIGMLQTENADLIKGKSASTPILVERYGSSLIFLSKIIPAVMLPTGVVGHHTAQERVYLPFLHNLVRLFTQTGLAPKVWESPDGLVPLRK